MIPLGTDTVTLIRRKETRDPETGRTQISYRRFKLKGCSWRHSEQRTRYNETIERSTSITCRVPSDQARPKPGDYMFLGNPRITLGGAQDLARQLEKRRDNGAFIVTTVKDNARPGSPLPHWAAIGE